MPCGVEEDVGRLEIAVHDAVAVQDGQRLENREGDGERVGQR